MPKKINKTRWNFNIGTETYDLENNCKPYRPVILDGKEIYKIDQTRFMGHLQNSIPDIIKVLKKLTKIEFTKEDLQKALTIGFLEKTS